MRILLLSNFFPPFELGGYGQLCEEVAIALKERGHAVHVLTSSHGLSTASVPDHPTIDIKRTLHLQSAIDHYRPPHFLRTFYQEETHNLSQLREIISSFGPDIVFVWGMWNLSTALPQLAEGLLPGRVAYYICSYWPSDEDIHVTYWKEPARRLAMRLLKIPLRKLAWSKLQGAGYTAQAGLAAERAHNASNSLIPPKLQFQHSACVSHYVRERLIDAGALPKSAKVIYNGGDLTAFYRKNSTATLETQKPLNLLYFGRLIADKGAHTALEALSLLQQQGAASNLRLTVLGDGRDDYISSLRRYAVEHEINHLIHFHEGVPRDEVPEWLHRHDIFLFTSTWEEPLARSVMEAMMAGLLVIGAAVGGQTEMMVDGENALTFAAGNSKQLAAHIKTAALDPALRARLAIAGQQMVQSKFTQKRMIDEIEKWLISIVPMHAQL